MARAHEHLASARYAEAAGAFRAVLRIDPNEFQAHFGLADALVARGQRTEAVDGLVTAAESCTARDDNGAALTLYGKALSVDPMRLELHLDVAMAEAALGRMEAAQSRLEHLAEVYMQAGRTDEAAEVYRCLAGWEGDGEELEDAEAEAAPVAPQRSTQVPTAAPARPPQREAVPMMVGSSETVVISTILITPDGQLLQLPIEQQSQAWGPTSGDTVPPVPAELLEVVHSAPIDLAEGQEVEDVERTVVGFPPPPPSLPENYESAAHTVNRSQLEAAVVAAMDNLAQLEEEDMTLIMQRLPPQTKGGAVRSRSGETRLPEFVTRSRMPKPELPPAPPEDEAEAPDEAEAETEAAAIVTPPAAAERKMRINPAPRPVAKPSPVMPASKPGVGKPAALAAASKGAAASKASAPLGAGKPAAGKPSAVGPAGRGAAATSKPAAAPVRASAPAGASRGAAPTSKPAATPARASAPLGAGKPGPVTPTSKGAVATSKPAAAPTRASAPASAGKPAAAPARASAPAASRPAAGKPAPVSSGPARPAAGPVAGKPAPGSVPPPGGEAAKLTRPNNPLAERLRRRAGLQKPDAAPGRPAEPRPTEPITVRSPSRLPPVDKSKKK